MAIFPVSKITITCFKYHTDVLTHELEELGYTPVSIFATGIEIQGDMEDCVRLNLNLRTASQVLYSLKSFTARNADAVYKAVKMIRWDTLLSIEHPLTITSTVHNDTVNNSMFANLKVKDAIVDQMRDTTGKRPDTSPNRDGAVVHLYWNDENAEIFIDTSGPSIARHGYRMLPGQAPMLEALAAATLLTSQWDKKSTLINPMCGSGTVAIEAALMACNVPPGEFRTEYGFMYILGYDPLWYKKEVAAINHRIVESPDVRIIATDISPKAISIARKNAEAAGVGELIEFYVCDFQDTEIPDTDKGIIFFNPEYGERLGEQVSLELTYKAIGDFLKSKCAGYWGYVFTGNAQLAKKIGLKPKRKWDFFNAKLDCKLMEFELYEGSRRIERED